MQNMLVKVGVLFCVTDLKYLILSDGPQNYDHAAHLGEPTTCAQPIVTTLLDRHRIQCFRTKPALFGWFAWLVMAHN